MPTRWHLQINLLISVSLTVCSNDSNSDKPSVANSPIKTNTAGNQICRFHPHEYSNISSIVWRPFECHTGCQLGLFQNYRGKRNREAVGGEVRRLVGHGLGS